MAYSMRFKHGLFFFDDAKAKETQIGEVISFSDSQNFIIPNKLVTKAVGLKNFPEFHLDLPSFILAFNQDKPINKELVKFWGYLESTQDKVGHLPFDKQDSISLMKSIKLDPQVYTGYTRGFKCYIIKSNVITLTKKRSYEEISKEESPKETNSNPYSFLTAAANPPVNNQPYSFLVSNNYQPYNFTNTNTLASYNLPTTLPPPQPIIQTNTSNLEQEAVDHYNKFKRNRETRHVSNIFHLRSFNNFVKAELMDHCIFLIKSNPTFAKVVTNQRGVNILDLACGKGGDFFKWLYNSYGINRYVGVDIAINSLKDFVDDRLLPRKEVERMKVYKLICMDLNRDSFVSSLLPTHLWNARNHSSEWKESPGEIPLSPEDNFDLISCQFAWHYMFESESTVHHMLSELSRHMHDQSLFLITTMDSQVLINYLAQAKHGLVTHEYSQSNNSSHGVETIPGFSSTSDSKGIHLHLHNEFHHELLTIHFEHPMIQRIFSKDESSYLGVKYTFQLRDNNDESSVDAFEYLVPQGKALERILDQHDLEIFHCQNFHDFVNDRLKNNQEARKKFQGMGVLNINSSLSDAEWSITKLYTTMIIRKKSVKSNEPSSTFGIPISNYDLLDVPKSPEPESWSPWSSPPQFYPQTPVHAPPDLNKVINSKILFQPHTPEYPPPPLDSSKPIKFQPHTPDYPPPKGFASNYEDSDAEEDSGIKPLPLHPLNPYENDDEEDDSGESAIQRLLLIRSKAIELGADGDEDTWDQFDEETTDYYLQAAEKILFPTSNASTI